MSVRCRVFLRDVLGAPACLDATAKAHLEVCSFCRVRVAARDRLVPVLAVRPRMHGSDVDLMASIRERIVEQTEESAFGQALERAMPVSAPLVAEDGWPEPLLDSEIGRRAGEPVTLQSAAAWSRVRGAILQQVAGGAARQAQRTWRIGALGAAVAVLAALLVFSQQPHSVPTIVFRDLDARELAAMSTVEFAVVRYGATR